jgi:cytochrome c biogenesis protein CcmG, thiol:disulfide interchange protein DsbE
VTGRLRLGAQVAAVGVVAALLGLLLWKVVKGDDNAVTGSLAKGELVTAPAWDLALLGGEENLTLESLRGKAVVLNFWASWCGPCKDETPLLQKSWLRWESKDVVFVGMNVKDFRGDARSFVRRFGVTYPNVYDGKGSTVGRYGVTGFPETYFIDARGRVVYRIAGPVADAEELDDGIRRALAPAWGRSPRWPRP